WAYSRETLRYIRNEILARHGYTFDVEKFREYFTGKSWYVPGGYSDASLSTTEWDNVALIKQVERAMDEMGLTNMHYLDIETIKYQQQNGLCPPW
ncbi:MAG: YARHG domain-containing protein, partial [Clostridia bacterium]|nr:YARHG domain-containing protein [Clostridia bacterium]